jgi:ABC-2 type transport system ATP-binding protein
MSTPAIDVRHVVKRYAEHTAVRDLSLRIPAGTVFGLLGPNGAARPPRSG